MTAIHSVKLHRFLLYLLAGAIWVAAPAYAQSPPPTEAPLTSRLWVEGSVSELQAATYEVGSGTETVPIAASVTADPTPWEVTVYIEAEISGPGAVRRVADLLINDLDRILDRGTLRIVRADPDPRTAVLNAPDRELIERGLYDLYFRPEASDRIRYRRSQWLVDRPQTEGTEGSVHRARANEESNRLRSRRDALLAWLATEGRSEKPRLLLLLDEGLELAPQDFYRLGQDDPSVLSEPSAEELIEVATSLGWAIAPVILEVGEEKPIEYRPTEDTPVGFRVGLGSGAKKVEASPLADDSDIGFSQQPGPRARRVAEATGGAVVMNRESLRDLFSSLDRRRWVEVEWPLSHLDGSYQLVVRQPSGRTLRAPSRASAFPSERLAEVRIRSVLVEESDGELPLQALIYSAPDLGTAELTARAEWSLVGQNLPNYLRTTIALQLDDGTLHFEHRTTTAEELPGGDFQIRRDLELPEDTANALVVVEALQQGVWGGGYAQFTRQPVTSGASPSSWGVTEEVSQRTVRILPLDERGTVEGRVEVTAETSDEVARLVFLLDGERREDLAEPPFRTRVRLGRGGERHIVEAIAYDAEGTEIGRDFLVLNEAAETFWVRITSPESGDLVGPVQVQAELQIPQGESLERLDYYWRNELIATSREDPHRRRLLIPFSNPSGFIRVEATLSSGRTTEDVVLMNSARFGAQVEVEVVELFVVVTDNDGKPVRSLDADAFEVVDSGVEQSVQTVRLANDLPLTVGLAIDSSGSLFAKLPRVQEAAARFVSGLAAGRDEAFLVGFGNRPRVVQTATRNLGRVSRGISDLSAGGRTAVWEAVVLSLLQLQDVDGRKALVVFYDGDDEDEDFSYRTALSLARETGVPIYLIVMNNTAARTDGKGFRTRSFTGKLDRMAQAGGGRVYYVATDANLDTIYDAISEELRSHYLISYSPTAAPNDSLWRSVEVQVKGRGLTARTLSGYDATRP